MRLLILAAAAAALLASAGGAAAQPAAADIAKQWDTNKDGVVDKAEWVAAAPESVPGVYDAAAEGYLGEPLGVRPVATDTTQPPEPIPAAFWAGLWKLLKEPRSGLGAVNLTTKTAALTGLVSPRLQARV